MQRVQLQLNYFSLLLRLKHLILNSLHVKELSKKDTVSSKETNWKSISLLTEQVKVTTTQVDFHFHL